MRLEEAIKIVEEEVKHPYSAKKMVRPDALKLLIEAGERYLSLEQSDEYIILKPLPGETLD